MQKTRFGLSANSFAALAFLAGIVSPLITLVMAGAVLLTEENDWLKRMVWKALAFVILMSMAAYSIEMINTALDSINGLLSYVDASFDASKVKIFVNLCASIVRVLEVIFLILFAKKAYAGQYVKLPVGDNIVEKNV